MDVTKVKLKIGRCQFNRELFPEQYTKENKMGLYSEEQKAAALAGAFNRGSNLWLDFSPFVGSEKQEKDAVRAAGLAFKPNWYFTFTPEGGGPPSSGQVLGTGIGVAISAIEGVVNVGGESADDSLGYHLRFHCEGEGTYEVTATLKVGDREFADTVTFKVS